MARWRHGRQASLNNKLLAKRAKYLQTELAKSNKEPVNAEWMALNAANAQNTWSAQAAAARAKLLVPAKMAGIPDDEANTLFYHQQYYYRHFSPDNQRLKSIETAKAWTARLPKSTEASYAYLSHATDYAKPEFYRDVAPLLLNQEWTGMNLDVARRLMIVASTSKTSHWPSKPGRGRRRCSTSSATTTLTPPAWATRWPGLNLKAEAKECWERALTGNLDTGDVRDSARSASRPCCRMPRSRSSSTHCSPRTPAGISASPSPARTSWSRPATSTAPAKLLSPRPTRFATGRSAEPASTATGPRLANWVQFLPRRREGHARQQAEAVHPGSRPARDPSFDDRPGRPARTCRTQRPS